MVVLTKQSLTLQPSVSRATGQEMFIRERERMREALLGAC